MKIAKRNGWFASSCGDCVDRMDAASVAASQQVRGRMCPAEPETGTSTSPQQALAHLSFWARLGPARLKRRPLKNEKKVGLERISEARLPGIL